MLNVPMTHREFWQLRVRARKAGRSVRSQFAAELHDGASRCLKLGFHEWEVQGGCFQLVESSWTPREERRQFDPLSFSRVASSTLEQLAVRFPRVPEGRLVHAVWQSVFVESQSVRKAS